MKTLKFKLREFIKEVYKIDVEELTSYDNFSFEHFSPDDYDRERFNTILSTSDLNVEEDIREDLLSAVVNRKYEDTYINEYAETLISTLSDKIVDDFKNLSDVMEYELTEANTHGKIDIKLDWYNDEIIFSGKISMLDVFIVNCINGHGMFHFSMKDFKEEGKIQDRIEGHLHWLNKFEEIYGTIYNIFKYDTSCLSRYYTFGNTYFELADIIEAYDCI